MNKDFQDYVDLVVQACHDLKAAKADGKISGSDFLAFMPTVLKIAPAIDGSSMAFKDIKAEDVKSAAVQILQANDAFDGKAAVYVEEGFNIVEKCISIYESAKKIASA